MNLYRIKRVKDGKYFNSDCHPYHGDGTQAVFGSSGVFFKTEETIRWHLQSLCYDQKAYYTPIEKTQWGKMGGWLDRYQTAGPFWDRLDLYIVETLVVLDSETIKQSAKDFMGILEDA